MSNRVEPLCNDWRRDVELWAALMTQPLVFGPAARALTRDEARAVWARAYMHIGKRPIGGLRKVAPDHVQVLEVLLAHARDVVGLQRFPDYEDIATAVGFGRATAVEAVTVLERAGLIVRRGRGRRAAA
jgi:hypothetical protein